ncbi:hypothetical protein F383_38751 [Gossypium arboreum]|uniref:Uncharacterized protein n=1 Tax=Gossypium arboreum TaxID=29729 RepID=A0A0B0MJP7_GOSAR|nr:hypothetical protein F383_38589 [Gossypium arboreum]KHF99823.1 hypothetical protein F383_38570 [Gossypium arboreum]KHG00024.1 hypothetical protein F383_38751 [Gossypium arboreum]
MDQSASLG